MKIAYEDNSIKTWLLRFFISCFHRCTKNEKKRALNLLRGIKIFSSLKPEQLLDVLKLLNKKKVAANKLVFSEGDLANNFYILSKGQVRISVGEGDDEVALSRLSVGDYFGDQALLKPVVGRRSANAKTLEDSEFLVLPRDDFFGLLSDDLKEILKKIGEKQLVEMLNKQLKKSFSFDDSFLKKYNETIRKYGYTIKEFSSGDIIFKAGEEPDFAYFLIRGEVSITLSMKNEALKVAKITSGHLFGERGILKQCLRAGTAVAENQVSVLCFDIQAFQKIHNELTELQRLTNSLNSIYQVSYNGVATIQYSEIDDLNVICASFQLESGEVVKSVHAIGKPIFKMAFEKKVKGTETIRFSQGHAKSCELALQEKRIRSIVSIGEVGGLVDLSDRLLNSQALSDDQITLFNQFGYIQKPEKIGKEQHKKKLCTCMNVATGVVCDAINAGKTSVEEITELTGAGSVCGGCRPIINELLKIGAPS